MARKKTAYRQRRKLHKAKERIKTLNHRVTKENQKLEMLKEHKIILGISAALRTKVPELAPPEDGRYTLKDYQKIIDLRFQTMRASSKRSKSKWGIDRLREEYSKQRDPLLHTLVLNDSYEEFIIQHELAIWVTMCTTILGRDQDKPIATWSPAEIESEWRSTAMDLWMFVGWRQRGRSFRFTSLLVNTFSMADIPVSSEFLESPFQFVAFEIPPLFYFPRKDLGKRSPVSDIVVGFLPLIEGNRALYIVATPSHFDSSAETSAVYFLDGMTIQESIDAFCQKCGTPTDAALWHQLLNFVCNALLYCTSFPDDVQAHNAAKQKKLQERIRRGGKGEKKARSKLAQVRNDTIYLVGKNFKLDDKRVSDELSQEDCTPRARHIVRGHWRNQAWGPRHTKRRLVFVPPHWRGTGPASPEKTYVVK